jgi:hypothetical protein
LKRRHSHKSSCHTILSFRQKVALPLGPSCPLLVCTATTALTRASFSTKEKPLPLLLLLQQYHNNWYNTDCGCNHSRWILSSCATTILQRASTAQQQRAMSSTTPTDNTTPVTKSGDMNETDLAADLEAKLKIGDEGVTTAREHVPVSLTTSSALNATESIPAISVTDETHETAAKEDTTSSDAPSPPPPPTLVQIANWVEQANHILVLTGAGVSVAAGIPDFRTPGTGLYDNLAKYKLPYAEAVFDIEYYPSNPHPFVQLAAELWPDPDDPKCPKPTLTHCFVMLLAEKGKLLRNYSQVMLTPDCERCTLLGLPHSNPSTCLLACL